MDLYPPDAVGDPTKQVHDFEPGIAPSGLFWTRPVAPSTIHVDAESGRARFHGRIALHDYGNFFNAIKPHSSPPPKPSHVTFDVRWLGGNDAREIRDAKFGYGATFIDGAGSVSFTASIDDSSVVYRSIANGQNVLYSGVGRERNGVFFA